jgi:hypothetical protein
VVRRVRPSFLLLLWLGCCGLAKAEAAPAQPMPARADSTVYITLGQSAVPLYGPWKFTVGDSPVDPATHTPLWAQPGFDDSQWETVDLTPKNGALDPWTGLTGYVPGWTAKGHAGYWGYAWYRIRVHLEARLRERLALAGPPLVDSVYQVFDNGVLVGSFGDFTSKRPVSYYEQPMMFPLPQPAGANPSSCPLVLAFRVWMGPSILTYRPDIAGGFRTAPVVGEADAVAAGYRLRWMEVFREDSTDAAEVLLFGLLAVVAFSLILFDRTDRVYLWMGTVFLLRATSFFVANFGDWTQQPGLSIMASRLIVHGFLYPLMIAGWVMVWWVWFGCLGHHGCPLPWPA